MQSPARQEHAARGVRGRARPTPAELAAALGPAVRVQRRLARRRGVGARSPNLEMVMRIPVTVKIVLGSATMPVANLVKLGRGAIIPLDRRVGEPVDVVVNGRVVARGEVVVVDEATSRFGIKLTEVVGPSAATEQPRIGQSAMAAPSRSRPATSPAAAERGREGCGAAAGARQGAGGQAAEAIRRRGAQAADPLGRRSAARALSDLETLVEEFAQNFSSGVNFVGTVDGGQEPAVGRHDGGAVRRAVLAEAPAKEEPVWERVAELKVETLRGYLIKEHPQTVAFILSRIELGARRQRSSALLPPRPATACCAGCSPSRASRTMR